MFIGLKPLLSQAIDRAGIEEKIKTAGVCDLWDKVIFEKFDKVFIEKCKAIDFRNGELFVAVLGSIFAQKLEFAEEEIIGEINKEAGRDIVQRIKFEI